MRLKRDLTPINLADIDLSGEASKAATFPTSSLILPVIVAVIVGLFLYTTFLQVTRGAENLYIAENNLSWDGKIPAARGLFYDVNGEKLVINQNSYSVWNTIKTASLDKALVCKDLENALGISLGDCEHKDFTKKVKLAGGIDQKQAILLGSKIRELELELIPELQRTYLYPEAFSQVIGYTGAASDSDVEHGLDYDDIVGKYRLEAQLDTSLRGVAGKRYGNGVEIQVQESIPGNNVVLTIDQKWQSSLYSLLKKQADAMNADGAASVILDADTGAIKAYVSAPSFDANMFSTKISAEDYALLLADKQKPLLDKVSGLQISPGSVFKLASSYALLQSGSLDPATKYVSTGCMSLGEYPFCEFGKYYLGVLDIKLALTRSSNIFFCNAVIEFEKQRSFADYQSLVSLLGFGSQTGIELSGELKGLLPGPEYKLVNYQDNWYSGDSCNTAIGQGMVLVTPIQMANLVAVIANGGTLYKPYVIDREVAQDGEVIEKTDPEVIRNVEMSSTTREYILAGMDGVVNNPLGTAYRFMHGLPGDIHAKTGSAETATMENGQVRTGVHGWTVGFFSFENHTYAFATSLVFGGGAWNITPVMANFISCVFNNFSNGCY